MERLPEEASLATIGRLVDQATQEASRQGRLWRLAAAQRLLGWAMRAHVASCRDDDVPWRAIATLIGVPVATLHRQFKAGGPIVVPPETPTRAEDRRVLVHSLDLSEDDLATCEEMTSRLLSLARGRGPVRIDSSRVDDQLRTD
jgi:hypothetical protein